jgi:hypothetical protein
MPPINRHPELVSGSLRSLRMLKQVQHDGLKRDAETSSA